VILIVNPLKRVNMKKLKKSYSTRQSNKIIVLSIIVLLIASINNLKAGDVKNEGIVEYGYKNNGKEFPGRTLKMIYKDGIVSYSSERNRRGDREDKEKEYIDYNSSQTYQVLTVDTNAKCIVKTPFSENEKPVFNTETEDILGYTCKKATITIRSNKIEVWYTDALAIKGSPTISVAPDLGLILKMVRNGSYEVYAKSIDLRKISKDEQELNFEGAQEVNDETYRRNLIDSRFEIIQVFNGQQINFGDEIVNPESDQIDKTYRYSKGTVILKKITIPPLNSGTTVIAELAAWSNGDAYDRTGSLFIIPTEKEISFLHAFRDSLGVLPVYTDVNGNEFQGVVATDVYDPPLELMRFFTPFGVRHFNDNVKIKGYDWADSVVYRQDIGDLLPQDSSAVWIGVFIGNYDKGGHKASLRLKIYPSFSRGESDKKWIKPLFNTLNIMEMSGQNYGTMFHGDSLHVTFEVPEGVKDIQLRYTSTGHGGWGGGDEFNPKLNEIFIDGKRVYAFIPWRTDCATYRLYNPASGNFGNGLSSSDLSRSNWCPGALTVPEIIELKDLTPGKHTMKIAIPIGKREGGSFSAWNVSGTLIGKFE
jgi:GLPGLI family protein